MKKPRATPRTVQRWLKEGIAPKTFDRLVESLAPSKATAARWRREKIIPEKALRSVKAPPKKKPAARPDTVARWLDEGIPERTFDRLVGQLAPSRATAERWQREELIPERVLVRLASETVKKWVREGIPGATFEKLVGELAPSKAAAARWREEGIPVAKLGQVAKPRRPKKPKRPKAERPRVEPAREPEEEERYVEAPAEETRQLEAALEVERAERVRLEAEISRRDALAERAAIEGEQKAPPREEEELEEPLAPEDVYPLPVRRLEFFREHDRTETEGITKIHFDPETGRIYGINDQGDKVAAYLFTNEDGQPKSGPDSLRWALAKDLEGYVAHVNRTLRERYGDATLKGAFGRFTMPRRAA